MIYILSLYAKKKKNHPQLTIFRRTSVRYIVITSKQNKKVKR